jgi:hypothetical protein
MHRSEHATIPPEKQIDVSIAVVGGGLAGVSAALAVARNGADVVLVHERSVLGGNSSSEVRVGPSGAAQSGYHRDARESGIIEEIFLETRSRSYGLRQVNGNHYPMWDVVLAEKVEAEPNLTLLLDTRVISVETEDVADEGYTTRITGLSAVQQGTEATFHITPRIVIDATGDGFVALQAGAPFRYGREARDEFGESWAPEEPDEIVLGSTMMFAARDVGRPVPYTPPSWAHAFPDEDSLPFRNHDEFDSGYWWIEWGGRLNTITDNEAIRRELHAAIFGVWDHIKNHCTVPGIREKAATWTLDWVGHLPGKRESRRFEGDYIMRESDVSNGIMAVPEDVVAYGGWPIDLHAFDGVYSSEKPCTQPPLPDRFGIPLRSLYSRTVQNLFMAGRNISQSHVAHGSTRVMKTCSVIGEGAGTAAAMAATTDTTPRRLANNPDAVRDLQQRILRRGAYLPTTSNADPDDLMRLPGVSLKASSEAALEIDIAPETNRAWELFGISTVESEILAKDLAKNPHGRPIVLDRATAQAVVVSGGRMERIDLSLTNTLDTAVTATLRIRQAKHLRDFGGEVPGDAALAVLQTEVAPGLSTVTFTPEQPITCTPNAPVTLHLDAEPNLAWMLTLQEPPGTQAGQWDDELGYWRWIHGTLAFDLSPVSRPYAAENVVSGITRPEVGTNMWISDPAQSLPQSLDVTWPGDVTLTQIELTFDSQLSGWVWEGPFPLVVRDYAIETCDPASGDWSRICTVTGNIQRRRVHTFNPITTSALRVAITATNGGNTARIIELRAYNEAQ